jgi:hypothetical protein
MPEIVPAGVAINTGQPLVAIGRVVVEQERVPGGVSPSTTVAIVVVGAPAQD